MNWLHFVGKTYYPNTETFSVEAEKYNVSRRISAGVMKKMNVGDRVFLMQWEKDHSLLFGSFKVKTALGAFAENFLDRFSEQESSRKERQETVSRGCGFYVINSEHKLETSLKKIAETAKSTKVGNLMIGGSYTPHYPVKCELHFTRGFRPFDYDKFESEAKKIKSENQLLKGKFEVTDSVTTEKTGEILLLNLSNYMKKPRVKRLQDEFKLLKKDISEDIYKVKGVEIKAKVQEFQAKVDFDFGKKTEEKSHLVEVFFGTDRKTDEVEEFGPAFGYERSDKLQLGICKVSIPIHHVMGEIERPKLWKLEFKENPKKHFVLVNTKLLQQQDFINSFSKKVIESKLKETFVFIHGFNIVFKEAAWRTAQIALDLGFKGAPAFFSWPSHGKKRLYMGDIDQARWAVPHMIEFIELILKRIKPKRINLIAHSMGSEVLTQAILQLNANYSGKTIFNQIILAAPDIDRKIFLDQIIPKMSGCGSRITLYASSNDTALKISRVFRGNDVPRAGEGGRSIIVTKGMDSIDASYVNTNLLGHGYFAETVSLINDMFSLICNDLPPIKRNLREKEKNQLPYWEFPRT